MTERPLDRLAKLCGVALTYRDITEREQRPTDATLRKVLAALGHDTDSDAALEASIATLESARWRRRLPPTACATVGQAMLALPARLPGTEAGRHITWRLVDEQGRRANEGRFEPGQLAAGTQRRIDDTNWVEVGLELPLPTDAGYYRLEIETATGQAADCLVIVAPERAFSPAALADDARLWGLTVQLYGLRSERNWGIGDFTDLVRVVEFVAARDGAFVGINPLHEIATRQSRNSSPYWPSSRRFLNPLYIDVEALPEYAECDAARALVEEPGFQAKLRQLRAGELVDYAEVAEAKYAVLDRLFRHFYEHHRGRATERDKAFETFCDEHAGLEGFLAFEALQAEALEQGAEGWGWTAWPAELRQAGAGRSALHRWREHAEFIAYLQWNAHLQLEGVTRRVGELDMGIGLCADLAVGTRHGGADSWVDRDTLVSELELGAPPDEFNMAGQGWGLPVWHPEALREAGYRPFIETLRANMGPGGGLRIDHIMSLMRCFVVPRGTAPVGGTYLHYRLDEMLAIVALESQRNRCLIVGEDLGTVPPAIREGMQSVGALGYRVLIFERDESGAVTAPDAFTRSALSVACTHDLPTLAGFWCGRDIEWRTELGLYSSNEDRERAIIARAEDRARLLVALEREGLADQDGATAGPADPELSGALRAALHAYLARTRSCLVGVQAEDLLGETEQANLPGTVDTHPNWRRRLGLNVEAWAEDAGATAVLDAVRRERTAMSVAGPRAADSATTGADPAGPRAVIPRATYRVQLHAGFGFEDLAAIVPYLDALGISHCYCSPYLKARPGSTHGYDVIDHSALNPEIGDAAGFDALSNALAERGMGQILDTVPNHVAVMGRDNAWWLDVLENGPASLYAEYFDIDWQPLKDSMRGKVLLPVLGDHYGNVVDRGELELAFDARRGSFAIEYYEHLFPIDPREYPQILEPGLEQLRQRLGDDDQGLVEFESLVTAFGKLPSRDRSDDAAKRERDRDRKLHQGRLARLTAGHPDIAHYIDECLRGYNGAENYPADSGRLYELLEAQAYRPAYWRLASHEINYRRFFDINELASLRMELPEVFEATHAFIFELVASGRVQGLRIDHPDGLYDPRAYFLELQRRAGDPDGALANSAELPLYVVAEKILAGDESLRDDWRVHGTTGYEFANLLTRFLVEPQGLAALDRVYQSITCYGGGYAQQLRESKRLIMQTALASELTVLANELDRLAEQDPHTRDFGLGNLHRALLEVVASFPVYRTYVIGNEVGDEDAVLIEAAVDEAKACSEAADTQVFEYLRDVLLRRSTAGQPIATAARASEFGMRLQQFTSPVAAKGMEDTAFYRYGRLVALNEVGGTPESPTASIETVHAANRARLERWPHAMLATSTHDAKRSEDVRARIAVLAELPDEWAACVRRWQGLNEGLRTSGAGQSAWPDPDFEYFLYQTLIGTWPLNGLNEANRAEYSSRITDYAIKAAREAKRQTSWINENTDYEAALARFIERLLDPGPSRVFISDFEAFHARILPAGLVNAMSQVTLKLTCPGVPDIYQGNELWRFDLVDPDNRRPVDFDRRRALLEALQGAWNAPGEANPAREAAAKLHDGRFKLLLTWRLLSLRREQAALFAHGSYEPVAVHGRRADQVLAFARRVAGVCLLVVVPRWPLSLIDSDSGLPTADRLGDTWLALPRGASGFVSRLTGRALETPGPDARIADLLEGLPVAAYIGHGGDR